MLTNIVVIALIVVLLGAFVQLILKSNKNDQNQITTHNTK